MKKLLAIVLATITTLSVLAVMPLGIGAEEVDVNPASILGSSYTTKDVLSFEESDIQLAPDTSRCNFEIADGAGISGKALKMTVAGNTCEGNISFAEQDWSQYEGLLYYVDLTDIEYSASNTANGQTGGVTICVTSNYGKGGFIWTRNTQAPVLENFDIATYYLENGEWKKSDNTSMNGARFNLPEKFKGWVYVPFTSYVTTKGPDGNPVQGIWGSQGIGKIQFMTGPYSASTNAGKSIIVDEIQLVKMDVVDNSAPTNILGNTDFSVKTVLNFDEEGLTFDSSTQGDRCIYKIVDGKGVTGKALQMTPVSGTCEGQVFFKTEQNWSDYDGVMYWLDYSAIKQTPENVAAGKTGGVTLLAVSNYVSGQFIWTRNTVAPVLPDFDIATYYYENGEWKKSDNTVMDGARFNLPENFKGWIYIPFTSYVSTKGPDGNPVQGVYGAEGIGRVNFMSGPYSASTNKDNSIIVDEIQLVKFNDDAADTGTDTEAPSTDTQAPDTSDTAADTATDTAAPAVSDTDTSAANTAAPAASDTDAADDGKGCGSSVGVGMLGVVAMTCGVALVGKRKGKSEDR